MRLRRLEKKCHGRLQVSIVKNASLKTLESPRLTKNWFFSQLDDSAKVEKNQKKLPLTMMFFNKYCEEVDGYQDRRIVNVVNTLKENGEPILRWKVMRLAGLSKQRLTRKALIILSTM